MKRNRLIYVLILILSLVGISFFGGPVSYGLFIVTILVPVVSFVYLFSVFLCFKIFQSIDTKYPTANKKIPFYFTLQNESFFSFVNIKVYFFSDFSFIQGMDDDNRYSLLPHTGIKRETSLVCKYRGEYEVGIEKVRIEDFLGLFSFVYKNPETVTAVVRPNLIYLEQIKNADINSASAKDTGIEATFKDITVRDYEDGDDIRYVNWKLSARENSLKVHKLISEERQGIGVIIDTKRYSDMPSTYIIDENKIMEITLAVSLYLASKNIVHTAYYLWNGLKEHNISGQGNFDDFYEEMSKLAFDSQNEAKILFSSLLSVKSLFEKNTVIMILQEWSDEAESMAFMLNEQDISVTAYVLMGNEKGTSSLRNPAHTRIVPVAPEDNLNDVI